MTTFGKEVRLASIKPHFNRPDSCQEDGKHGETRALQMKATMYAHMKRWPAVNGGFQGLGGCAPRRMHSLFCTRQQPMKATLCASFAAFALS